MSALLEERSKRHRNRDGSDKDAKSDARARKLTGGEREGDEKKSLKSLVESVKRKSAAAANAEEKPMGKRRKL